MGLIFFRAKEILMQNKAEDLIALNYNAEVLFFILNLNHFNISNVNTQLPSFT